MSSSEGQWVSESKPLTHQEKNHLLSDTQFIATRLFLKSHPNIQKGTIHKVMGKYMRIFPENKALPSSVLHQQLQYVVGESLHFSLWPFFKSYPEILFHSESKKDCFCQNMPHKKFIAIQPHIGPHHGVGRVGQTREWGQTHVPDAALVASFPVPLLFFVFYPLNFFR